MLDTLYMAMLFGCFKPRTDDGRDSASHNEDGHTSSTASGTRVVTYVELLRRTSEPLGLVLDGGTDRDMPVVVSQLYPGGVADNSGTLQRGDVVLSINGVSTDPLTHQEVTSLLQNAGNFINLEIAYDAPPGGANLDADTVKKTSNVTFKKEGNAFGFTISGGKTEGRPITVSHVLVGTAAYRRGTLKAGDRIMKIQGADVRRATKKEALSLLQSCGEDCTLEIEYDVTLHSGLSEGNRPLQVEILKPKSASLGISLKESRSPHPMVLISHIREAGIAYRCGALHVGDQLLAINETSLENKAVNEAVQLLIHSDFHVKLDILPGRAIEQGPELTNDEAFSDSMSHVSRGEYLAGSQASRSQLSLTSSHTHSHLPYYPDTMEVTLHADSIGFGLSLDVVGADGGSFLTIATIVEGGPAARLGQLSVGDRVLAINGIRMKGVTLEQAVKIVHEAGDVISMEVEFDITDTVVPTSGTFDVKMVKTSTLNLGITINGSHHRGDLVWISNLKKGGIACRAGILQPGDVILSINQQSLETANLEEAAMLLKGCGDVVTLTISKDSTAAVGQQDPVIYSIELIRNGQGLGITLKGSQSQPNHPITIADIKEGGVAYSTGTMRTGDQILAINGESLHMKTVPEAVQMLQRSGDVVTLKICKAIKKSKGMRSRPKTASPTGKLRHSRSHSSRGVGVLRYGSSSPLRPYTSSSDANSLHHPSGRSYTTTYGYGNGNGNGNRLMTRGYRPSSTTPTTMTIGLGTPLGGSPEGRLMEDSPWDSSHSGTFPAEMMNDPRLEGVAGYHGTGSTSMRPSRGPPDGGSYLYRPPGGGEDEGVRSRRSFTETDEELTEEELPRQRTVAKKQWDFKSSKSGKAHASGSSRGSVRRQSLDRRRATTVGVARPVRTQPDAAGSGAPLEPRTNVAVPMLDPDRHNAAKAGSDAASEEDETLYKKAIMESAKFQQQLKAIADSGSSDPDSDIEPPPSAYGVQVDSHYGGQMLDPRYRGGLPLEYHVQQRLPPGFPLYQEEVVALRRHSGEKDFGFSVASAEGGGVHVKGLRPGGPAELCRHLHPLDRIVEINGVDVKDSDCDFVLPLLRESGSRLELVVIKSNLYSSTERNRM